MGVQLPLPAPSSFHLSHFLLLTYVGVQCAADGSRADFGYKFGCSANPFYCE